MSRLLHHRFARGTEVPSERFGHLVFWLPWRRRERVSETFGHRAVPHTADVRVEAWGPTRELCIAEAVLGTVEAFLDTSSARPASTYRCHLSANSDEDLLVAVLDEVIYLLDTAGAVPLDVELEPVDGDIEARFATVAAATLPQVGAVPKGVSLHELSLASGPAGWSCSVTLDV